VWADIELCRYVNQLLGTNYAPWELDQIPDIWLAQIVSGLNIQAQVARQKAESNG